MFFVAQIFIRSAPLLSSTLFNFGFLFSQTVLTVPALVELHEFHLHSIADTEIISYIISIDSA